MITRERIQELMALNEKGHLAIGDRDTVQKLLRMALAYGVLREGFGEAEKVLEPFKDCVASKEDFSELGMLITDGKPILTALNILRLLGKEADEIMAGKV